MKSDIVKDQAIIEDLYTWMDNVREELEERKHVVETNTLCDVMRFLVNIIL